MSPRRVPPYVHVTALLAADFVSSIAFALLFSWTRSVALSVAISAAAGAAGIAWTAVRGRPVIPLQWTSLGLVVGLGGLSLVTRDPRFAMVKPALVYAVVGAGMLKEGWMLRYLPPVAQAHGAGIARTFGRIWAAAMFGLAALSLILALRGEVRLWALIASAGAPTLKIVLAAAQYAITRRRVIRAHRAEAAGAPVAA